MIQPGDLFFTTSGSPISTFIRYRTWGKYSHVQVITQDSVLPDGSRLTDVVSADQEGVMLRAVRTPEWEQYAILTCPGLTERQRHDILDFCFRRIGKGYDFLGLGSFLVNADLNDEDRYFCSELAFLAYREAGADLLKRLDHAFVSPMHLYISPILEIEEEKGGE